MVNYLKLKVIVDKIIKFTFSDNKNQIVYLKSTSPKIIINKHMNDDLQITLALPEMLYDLHPFQLSASLEFSMIWH